MRDYHSWDELTFRRLWAQDSSAILPTSKGKISPLIVLDELDKNRRRKRDLKGIFDTRKHPCDILVTRSARLNAYMKGRDNLLGRHLNFRLHPSSLREMDTAEAAGPDEAISRLFSQTLRRSKRREDSIAALMTQGPFPEPLLAQDKRKARIWHGNHEQPIFREDLRDLGRLPDLGRVEMLNELLPERIGSIFSFASIGCDLEVSIPTVKRWIGYLKALDYLFEVRPYHEGMRRSLRREGKVYLRDYSAIKNEAARFENLVACHLLKSRHSWTGTGEGEFQLYYLRNKEKQEIDFLIVRDGFPWLPVEVEPSDAEPPPIWRRFASLLSSKRGIQIVRRPIWKLHDLEDTRLLVDGTAHVLAYFA